MTMTITILIASILQLLFCCKGDLPKIQDISARRCYECVSDSELRLSAPGLGFWVEG